MDDPLVRLFYEPRAPSHYVAKLGPTGWLEGFGWTQAQAFDALAASVMEHPPSSAPPAALASTEALVVWLAEACSGAELAS